MKLQYKIQFLINNYWETWYETRRITEEELSNKQSIICVCGRLATGMHESYCSRFRKMVDKETVKRLDYLKVFPDETRKLAGLEATDDTE